MPANTQTCQYFTGQFSTRGVYGKTATTTCQYFTGNFADRFVVKGASATNATYTASATQSNLPLSVHCPWPVRSVSQSQFNSIFRIPMRILSTAQGQLVSLVKQNTRTNFISEANSSTLNRQPQLIRNAIEANIASMIKKPMPGNTNTAQSSGVSMGRIPGVPFSIGEGNISSLTKVPEIVYDISQSSTSSIVKQPVTNFSVTEAQFSATLGLAGRSFSASEGSLTNLIRSPQLSRKTIETTSATQLKFPAHSSITAEGQNAVTVKEPQPGAYVASQSSSGLYNQGFPVSNSATEGSTASIVRSPQSVINIVETVSTLHFKSVSRANAIRQAQLAVINKLLALGYFVGQANSSVRSSQFVSNMDITQGSNANNSQTVSKQIVAEQIQSPLAIKLVAKTLIGTQPQVAFILKCVLSVFGPISQICVAAMIGRGYTPSSLLLFIAQVYADLFDAQTVDDSYIPNTYADDYNITGEKD